MKRKVLPILTRVAVVLMCCFYGVNAFAQGDGTASNAYRIRTKEQLIAFANCLATGNQFYYDYDNKICVTTVPESGSYNTIPAHGEGVYFVLMRDITLNQGNVAACDGEINLAWTVWPETGVFKGHLLGETHTISGMYIDRPEGTMNVGFFSKMEGDAHVEKLGIVNSYVKGGASNIGGMVGELSGGHISNSFFEGSIRTSGNNVGGLIGLMTEYSGTLPEVSVCFASGHLDCSGDYVAGLVGKVEKGTVRQNYSSMIVRTTDMVGVALSGANPTNGGIGTDVDIAAHHVGGIYGYTLDPNDDNSYDPATDSIRVDTCYFDWQLSDLPSIPGSTLVPADWRDNRGVAALSTYDMTYYSQMYFDIKNQKPSLWKNTYLCNMYPYPDPFNDPINVTYRLELDYPQDSIVIATLVPFLDVFMKPNGNGQSTINNMNDQERQHMKLSDLTESFVLWKLCDSLEATWTLDNLWPDAVRREFYAPDNSWNVYLQKQGVVRLTIEVAGRTRYYDAVVNIPPYVGSAENPFLISNLEDFLAFRDGINANKDFVYHRFLISHDSLPHIHWIQTADIDLASAGDWVPIGKNADTCFTGFYDGRGHRLMNLTMTNGTDRALFIHSKGDIKNLVIEDPNITGCGGSSAALATNVQGGHIENCGVTYSTQALSNSTTQPLAFNGTDCAALIGNVGTANDPVDSIAIVGCFNSCTVTNTTGNAAGMVGYVNATTCRIERCFNTGDITASGKVHPIVALFASQSLSRSVTHSYNAGVLTGTQDEVESANTTFYNDYHVNPVCEGATKVATRHFIGTEALVREYMGDDDWIYEEGRYPRLRWTESSSARLSAIAACTPRTAIDHLPLPDTMTVDNFHDLNNLRSIVNGNYMVIYKDYLLPHYVQDIVFSLTADINLYDISSNWIPIGTKRFAGTFLGNNHTLNKLNSTWPVVGLFGTLTGKVYDLNITVNTITGADTAGAVCAILNGGRIENCSVKKFNNISDNLYGVTVGGIAGVSLTASDSIVGCFNYVDVMGIQCVGGIIAEGGNVRNSANAGDITGKADCPYIGGISGRNTNVTSSLNTGIVTALPGNTLADNYVGGLVGKIENGELRIENCYNAGIVNGENRRYVGGLCGVGAPQYCYVSNTVRSTGEHLGSIAGQGNGTILKCCYDNQMSTAKGIDGSDQTGVAEGMSTADMMGTGNYSTFWGENASTNIWYYSDNYYPQLQGIRSLNTIFSTASAMRAKLYTTETYSTVSHQFTLNYADGGNWQRIGGSNCVSLGSPSNNLITATIPSTNNHPAQGFITLGFKGAGTNDPVYRKVQLWVNLTEDNPLIIKDSLQLTRFRTIINQGSGYYNSATQTFFTSGSYNTSQYVRITDGGRNLYFKLTADVDLAFHGTTSSGQSYNVLNLWTSIGTKNRPFLGHFDGGNHTVKNFIIPGNDNQGFFGYIYGGTVKNLTIAGAITNHNTTGDHRGILCGYNNSGTIHNCFITQDVGSNYHSPSRLSAITGRNLGFICGTNHYGRIVRCQTDMTQIENPTYTHGSCFGGICGYNDFGTIDSCRSHLAINPGITIDTVGGIVGYNHNGILRADTAYNNRYNKSIMSYVGCIAGYSNGTQSEIRSCYVDEQSRVPSIGDYIGGVVGKMDDGIIDGCEHLGTIIAEGNYIGGIAGLCTEGASVSNSLNAGTVCESKSDNYVGGIVGLVAGGQCSVSSCFNSGLVMGRYFVGGIVGKVESGQWTVEDCYNTGIVKGIAQVGGMAGILDFTQGGSFAYGYSAGWVEGSSMTGAVIGYSVTQSPSHPATQCYHDLHYDKQMCSYKGVNEEDVTGVTAHTTSEMMAVTFTGRFWEAGTESMYPRLTVFSGTDVSKVSALALQIGDVYDLSYNPTTSYTLPSYTPASGTFAWSKIKSSDNTAALSGTTLTPSGMRNFMRIKATVKGIPLRYVQLSFGISEQQPLVVTSVGFPQLRTFIKEGQTFYYANGIFLSTNQQVTDATPIPADADGFYFRLNTDVNYTAYSWLPIGTEEHPFRGYLDGAGHSVHVSFINTSEDLDFWGLFGYLQGRVKNLFLYDVSLSADNHDHVGALAGFCNGTVSHCGTLSSSTATPVVQGQTAVGGLIGEAYYSQVFDCYNGFDVKGTQSVGGLVGLVSADGALARSFNYGLVKATGGDSRVGGLVGSISNSEFRISNCYNTGAVKGETNVSPFVGSIQNSKFEIHSCYNAAYIDGNSVTQLPSNSVILCFNDRQLYPQELPVFTSHLYTSEMLGDGLRSQLGDTWWSYNDDEYPRLKNFENTVASIVSVKPLDLGERMQANNIVKNFGGETSDGVKWYRHGTGTALNTPNPTTANGIFTLNTCGVDSLKVTLTSGPRVERRVVPVVVTGAGVTIDTVRACAAYTWEPTNDYSVTLDKPGFHTYLAEGDACENTKAIELYFADPIEVSITKHDACMDSYWSKYGHNIGYLKATAGGGGFGDGYAYEWSRENGTIADESYIAGHPDSLRYLSSDYYYLTTTDVTPHSVCERRDTVLVDEYSFNYLVTKWGNCVDQADGWIELVIRQFEFNRDGSPYKIEYWDSNHESQGVHWIQALNPPDESGVPKGYDTLFNLDNGLYYMTITDRLGCYQDKQIKVNDPINPKMTLRAKGLKKVYDGIPVTLNSINVVEYDDNWKVPERAEYYVTSDQWRQLALRIGDSLIVSLANPDLTVTDVDSVRIVIDDWHIKDAETGKDKTCLYHFYPIDSCVVIMPAPVTVKANDIYIEQGQPIPALTATVTGMVPGESESLITYTLSLQQGDAAGTYTITPSGAELQGNYKVTFVPGTLTFTEHQPITVTANSSMGNVYDGTEKSVSGYTISGLPEGYTLSGLTTSSPTATNVGTYTNTISGTAVVKNADNEDESSHFVVITINGTLEVVKRPATVAADSKTKVYDNNPSTDPALTVTVTGAAEGDQIAFSISRQLGQYAGTYAIEVSVNENDYPNYQLTILNSQFTISRLLVTVTPDDKSKTYGSADPTLTATLTDTVAGERVNYTLSRTAGEAVGSYAIVVTPDTNNNYELYFPLQGVFSITPKAVTVTPNDASKTYGDDDPTFTATSTGLVGSDVLNYTLTRAAGEDVGTYEISVSYNESDNPNYQLSTLNSHLTIAKRSAMLTVDPKSKVYGAADPTFTATATGTVGSDVLDYTLTRTAGEDVGTYPITVTLGDNPNYQLSTLSSQLSITKAAAVIVADEQAKSYGDPDPDLTATVSGLRNSDQASIFTYSLSREPGESVGNYEITPTGATTYPNYTVHYETDSLTISKAELEITTGSAQKEYDGTALTNPDYTVTGLKNDETITVTVTGSQTDIGYSDNTYDLTWGTANQGNYHLIDRLGLLTVMPQGAHLNVGTATWHAISTPMHEANQSYLSVSEITNLDNATYDLFRYDEENGRWENQKAGSGADGFTTLEAGRGYLYRRATEAWLTFVGQPNSGSVNYNLSYNCGTAALKGFNLVGNPYNHTTSIGEYCYSLNPDGTWRPQLATYEIPVANAVLVHTTSERTLTFTEPSSKKKGPSDNSDDSENSDYSDILAFSIADTTYEDIVYALFSEGDGLPKMGHLSADAPTISIHGYAIAHLDDTVTSFPLTLKAAPGEYTLALSSSTSLTSSTSYLHLIDKLADRDIDLLKTPSYTFTATGNDANRFLIKLSPDATQDDDQSAHFAHQQGNEIIIDGEGTLEVYDVVGRQLFTKEISPLTSHLSPFTFPSTGVYVLRLNGQSQKIVIK